MKVLSCNTLPARLHSVEKQRGQLKLALPEGVSREQSD